MGDKSKVQVNFDVIEVEESDLAREAYYSGYIKGQEDAYLKVIGNKDKEIDLLITQVRNAIYMRYRHSSRGDDEVLAVFTDDDEKKEE